MLWYLLGYETEEAPEVEADEQTKRLRHNMLKEIRRMRVIDTLCEMTHPTLPSVIVVPVSEPIDIPQQECKYGNNKTECKYGNRSRTRHNRMRKKKRKRWS